MMMRKLSVVLVACFLVFGGGWRAAGQAQAPAATAVAPAPAQAAAPAPPPSQAAPGGVLDVGAAFGWLAPYVDTTVSAVLSALVGWVLLLLKSKLNLSVDQSHRDALQSFVLRQASSLVADGFVRMQGLKVTVDSTALRNAAELAGRFTQEAVQHFGITPQTLQEMIVDKIPHVPTVASATPTVAPVGPTTGPITVPAA